MGIALRSVLASGNGTFDLDSLTITTPASKTTFKKGDPIDLTGLVVTGVIGNMSGNVTSDCIVTPSVFNTVGTDTVTLSYGGLSVSYTVTVTNELRIVPWATGTDLEIAAMLAAHYDDEINIYECEGWNIGAEREVALSAMSAGDGVGETHVAQTVKFMLLDKNVRDLVTPINGHTKCAFVVGQTASLSNNGTVEPGYMHNVQSTTDNGGWGITVRRAWCNNTYKNALPANFCSLFKPFKYLSNKGKTYSNAIEELQDTFVLPAAREIFGAEIYDAYWSGVDATPEEGSQFAKYASITDFDYPRYGDPAYWTRSAGNSTKGYSNCFYKTDQRYCRPNGTATSGLSNGFRPQGVI